jgi:DNA-binding IclR family transcriptional regulator
MEIERGTTGKSVGAVTNAVKILRYLSAQKNPAGVSRIARDTQINPSTCFNILRTLAHEDLVLFDPGNKSYSLSLGILDIARGATALQGNLDSARPILERIAEDLGITLTLWQPVSKNRKVMIYSAVPRDAIRIQMAIGQRLPLFIGSTGRVFAAFGQYSDEEMHRLFKDIKWNVPLSYAEFRKQTEETRIAGWAIDEGHFAIGTVSIAVPIFDGNNQAMLSLTATMFVGQYSEKHRDAIVLALQKASTLLGRIVLGN